MNLAEYRQVPLVRGPKVKTSTQTWEVETAGSKAVYRACMDSVAGGQRAIGASVGGRPGGRPRTKASAPQLLSARLWENYSG